MARYVDIEFVEDMLYNAHCISDGEYCGYCTEDISLSSIPTADVVEVVRCKDCIHWGGVTYGFVCRKLSGIETKICMGADHFCSYGERGGSNDV